MFLFAPRKFECKKIEVFGKMAPSIAQVTTFQLHLLAPNVDVDKTGFCTDGRNVDGNRRHI